jgi:hypothetical protein
MGYFTYDRNLDACIKCPEGYHGFDSRPYAFCKACQRGKFGYAEAAVSEDYGCTACFAGRFNENIGLAASAASSSSLPNQLKMRKKQRVFRVVRVCTDQQSSELLPINHVFIVSQDYTQKLLQHMEELKLVFNVLQVLFRINRVKRIVYRAH